MVDDILSLSKIRSQMLTVSPVRTDIKKLIQRAIMMFSAELKASNIVTSTVIGEALRGGEYHELMIDSSRVLQILVNLISNAIKFTRASADRKIDIHCDVHSSRPSASTYNIKYMDSQAAESISERTKDDGGKEQIYLHFIVQDTGIGMSDSQKELLFTRFAQGQCLEVLEDDGLTMM